MKMTVKYKTYPKTRPSVQVYPPVIIPYDFWARTSIRYDLSFAEIGFSSRNNYFQGTSDQIAARDMFLCSGLLTGPAKNIYDYTAWGSCIQYARCLRPSIGHLRLVSEIESWDERKKGLFAEALSIGLAGYALWHYDEVIHIADAGPFIGRSIAGPYANTPKISLRSMGIYGKNGKYKPDFLCLTKSDECVIVEVKGGIGPPSCLSSDFKKGKEQVENVKPDGIPLRSHNNRLVFGTNLRYEHNNVRTGKDSTLKVMDPEKDDEPISIKINQDELVLNSYKSVLRFAGRDDLIFSIDTSIEAIIPEDLIDRLTVQVQGLPIFPIFAQDGLLIGIYSPTASEIFASPREGLAKRVSESLFKLDKGLSDFRRMDDGLMLPNGILISKNLVDPENIKHILTKK
jgi:hypothetical protein